MFNEAAAPGEILNCVNALRGAFMSGQLFGNNDNKNEEELLKEIVMLRELLNYADNGRIDGLKKIRHLNAQNADLLLQIEQMTEHLENATLDIQELQNKKTPVHKIVLPAILGFVIAVMMFGFLGGKDDTNAMQQTIVRKNQQLFLKQQKIEDLEYRVESLEKMNNITKKRLGVK